MCQWVTLLLICFLSLFSPARLWQWFSLWWVLNRWTRSFNGRPPLRRNHLTGGDELPFFTWFFPRSGGKLSPQRPSIWSSPAGNTSDPVHCVLDRIFSPSKPTKCRERLKNDILWIPTINSVIVIFHFIWAIDNSHSSHCLCPIGRKIKAVVFNLWVGIA